MAIGTQANRGDSGVLISINMGETMVGATGLNFEIQKPDGKIINVTPTINGNSLEYRTVAGDIDVVGEYRISPQLVKGSFDGRGKVVFLKVVDKFEK